MAARAAEGLTKRGVLTSKIWVGGPGWRGRGPGVWHGAEGGRRGLEAAHGKGGGASLHRLGSCWLEKAKSRKEAINFPNFVWSDLLLGFSERSPGRWEGEDGPKSEPQKGKGAVLGVLGEVLGLPPTRKATGQQAKGRASEFSPLTPRDTFWGGGCGGRKNKNYLGRERRARSRSPAASRDLAGTGVAGEMGQDGSGYGRVCPAGLQDVHGGRQGAAAAAGGEERPCEERNGRKTLLGRSGAWLGMSRRLLKGKPPGRPSLTHPQILTPPPGNGRCSPSRTAASS